MLFWERSMAELILGVDTSNYRTSVALVNEKGEILYNHRELLKIPDGKKGLRQSEAFFQHVMRLPEALEPALEYRDKITKVTCSSRPRPREGSYMPCFMAGERAAREVAMALNVPFSEFSHQEGHVEAVKYYSPLRDIEDAVFFHFSGGTTEAVYKNEIAGGTLDIAFGQVLDRLGQKIGLKFPSGEELDRMALTAGAETAVLKPVNIRNGYLNMSGLETQSMRQLEALEPDEYPTLVREVFHKLTDAIVRMTLYFKETLRTDRFIFAGGVSASVYIRNYLKENLPEEIVTVFGDPELSGDNAVGVALLGLSK